MNTSLQAITTTLSHATGLAAECLPETAGMKRSPIIRPCRLAAFLAVTILAIFPSTHCLGGELAPFSPTHARLLEGRKLLIDTGGAIHVEIAPAPVVRLTDNLLSLTFAFPSSGEEALEIAELPHTGAIVQSRKALDDLVGILESSGFAKNPQEPDIDSFTFKNDFRGMEFGEKVTQREDGGFTVEFVALVSLLEDERSGAKRVRRFSYNFQKDEVYHPGGHVACYSESDLMIGPPLAWQTMEGSKPPRVSEAVRLGLERKMLAVCGKVLPPGRQGMRPAE